MIDCVEVARQVRFHHPTHTVQPHPLSQTMQRRVWTALRAEPMRALQKVLLEHRTEHCRCPHWGIVSRGKIIFRCADHDVVFQAGDAYYGAPGHLPLIFAGTVVAR